MPHHIRPTSFILSLTCAVAVAFIYLFIAISVVPYWQTLDGPAVQSWFAEHFGRFSYLMVPLHCLAIITIIWAYVRQLGAPSPMRWLWLLALVGMMICQGFNFLYFHSQLNVPLQSEELAPEHALATLDKWDSLHWIRTWAVSASVDAMVAIALMQSRLSGKPHSM